MSCIFFVVYVLYCVVVCCVVLCCAVLCLSLLVCCAVVFCLVLRAILSCVCLVSSGFELSCHVLSRLMSGCLDSALSRILSFWPLVYMHFKSYSHGYDVL